MSKSDFRNELETLINQHSKENGSDTPDFILAEYIENCLAAFDAAVNARSAWWGITENPSRLADPKRYGVE